MVAAPAAPEQGCLWSGGLDRGDLELEGDLVADQHAAGLERGVPVDAVVLAVDRRREPSKPTRWLPNGSVARALELEGDADRLGDALDGQVAGDLEAGRAGLLDAGRDEGDLRVVLDVEEVVAAQVARRAGALRVSMLAAWMVTLTGRVGRVGAVDAALPSKSLNAPRTLVTIACRATKPMRLWAGSRT